MNVHALFESFTPPILRVQMINSKIMERVLPVPAPALARKRRRGLAEATPTHE